MSVFVKKKVPDIQTGLLEAKSMCQCKRKSFSGVKFVTPDGTFEYTWEQIDTELAKLEGQ